MDHQTKHPPLKDQFEDIRKVVKAFDDFINPLTPSEAILTIIAPFTTSPLCDYILQVCTEISSRFQCVLTDNWAPYVEHRNNFPLKRAYYSLGPQEKGLATCLDHDDVGEIRRLFSEGIATNGSKIKLYDYLAFPSNYNEYTYAEHAAQFGAVKCLKFLLLNGSSPPAMKFAIAGQKKEIMAILADITPSYEESLEQAVQHHFSAAIIWLMEIKGHKITPSVIRHAALSSNFHFFENFWDNHQEEFNAYPELLSQVVKEKNMFLMRCLIELVHVDPSMGLPLIAAAELSEWGMFIYLLRNKSDPNSANEHTSVLNILAQQENVEKIALLSHAGADLDLISNGTTALISATRAGSVRTVLKLLELGADCHVQIPEQPSAFEWALENAQYEIIKALSDKGARPERFFCGKTPLLYGVNSKNPKTAALLIELGCDVNDAAPGGWTPLMEAASKNRIDMAEVLLAHGAKVNLHTTKGRTALHWAIGNGHTEMAEFLKKHGAASVPDLEGHVCDEYASYAKTDHEKVPAVYTQKGKNCLVF